MLVLCCTFSSYSRRQIKCVLTSTEESSSKTKFTPFAGAPVGGPVVERSSKVVLKESRNEKWNFHPEKPSWRDHSHRCSANVIHEQLSRPSTWPRLHMRETKSLMVALVACCTLYGIMWRIAWLNCARPRGLRHKTLTMSRDGSTKLCFTTEVYSGTHRWRDGRVKERTGYNS